MQADLVRQAWWEGISPPPRMTVTQWADTYRVMPSTAAESGPYRSSRTPFWREVADRFAQDDPCEQIVVMKGAQIGASEALGMNPIGYHIHIDPCTILFVRPTETDGEKVSKQRIQPMIEGCPELYGRVGEQKTRRASSTILEKHYPDGSLTIGGANSPTGLSSIAARLIICDEVDRFPLEAGEEGDPIQLAFVRSRTFPNRKMVLISTPATKGKSRIEAAYADSSRARYHVPCPHCGTFQPLEWGGPGVKGGVKWEPGRPAAAWYECAHCGEAIEESAKEMMVELGVWEHENPDHPVKGYQISALYSPWLRWGEAAVEFLAVRHDPVRLKVWINTTLGEPWDEDAGGKIEQGDIMAMREPFAAGVVPAGAGVLTAAVDVQHNRLEMVVRAWGIGEESWTIERRVLQGDPSGPAPWDALEMWRHRRWPTAAGGTMALSALAVDSGYLSQVVYAWCGPRHGSGVYAVKGRGGEGVKVWPRRPAQGKNKAGGSAGCPIYTVGVDSAKDRESARLRASLRRAKDGADREGPGQMHFPVAEWCDQEFFDQLTAEVRRPRPVKGRMVWEWFLPAKRKNEVLDLHVYSYAVLQAWLAMGWSLDAAVAAASAPPVEKPPAEAPPKPTVGFRARAPALPRRR